MDNISTEVLLYSPKSLVFKRVKEFYVVLNPDIPNFMVVDDIGKELIESCDGNHTVDEIVECIRAKYASQENTKENLLEFITSLTRAGFLYMGSLVPEISAYKWEKLRQLHLHLTHECNLRCRHCYANAGTPLENEMTPDEFLGLIKDFATLGGEQLVMTGGEPFLRRELVKALLPEAKNLKLNVFIESNGTLITEEDAKFCSKNNAQVGVSLDGANEKSHDYIRGVGTFNKSISSIKILVQNGVRTTIGMTLMNHNLTEAKEMIYLAEKLGASAVSFSILRITGRSKENPDLYSPVEKLATALKEARKTAIEVGIKTGMEDILPVGEGLQKRASCGVGVALLSIAANGEVYPCNMLQAEGISVGNVKKQCLKEIWESNELKMFREFSVLDVEECRDCELKFLCGSCPGDSFHAYRDFRKRSPFCSLYKEVYWDMITQLASDLWNKT